MFCLGCMNMTKVFSNVNQTDNGAFVRLQNYSLKSKDTSVVCNFAAVIHWLVPFLKLQHDVSFKRIGFFPFFPHWFWCISLCHRGMELLPEQLFPSLSLCCSVGSLLPCLWSLQEPSLHDVCVICYFFSVPWYRCFRRLNEFTITLFLWERAMVSFPFDQEASEMQRNSGIIFPLFWKAQPETSAVWFFESILH